MLNCDYTLYTSNNHRPQTTDHRPIMNLRLKTLLITLCISHAGFSQNVDVDILRSINPRHPDSRFWNGISSSAKPIAVAVPVCLLGVSLIEGDKQLQRVSYEMAAGLVITAVVTQGLKITVNRPRPYYSHTGIYPSEPDDSPSFPSGHTAMAFSTATSVALNTKKWYVIAPAFAWAGCVGYSRLYLGQHYPTDVLGGAIVGAASAYAAHWLNKKLFKRK
jgi:membrane-associated phospholipid phosphatase